MFLLIIAAEGFEGHFLLVFICTYYGSLKIKIKDQDHHHVDQVILIYFVMHGEVLGYRQILMV